MANLAENHQGLRYRALLITIIVVSIAIHITSLLLSKTYFADWRLEHLPFHSVIEVAGAFIAFFVAYLLFLSDRRDGGTSFNIVIACALIGMGIFDGLHALAHPGQSFVWLHSIATFVGGLLFSGVFFSDLFFRRWKIQCCLIVVFTCLLIGILSMAFPDSIPVMVINGHFSDTAIFLNLVGGGLLISAAIRLVFVYKKTRRNDDLLFVLLSSMFGLAAIMFQQSVLWDAAWWGWHTLRLMAYGVALWFAMTSNVIAQINNESQIQLLNEVLNEKNQNFNQLQEVIDYSENIQDAIIASLNDALVIATVTGEITAFMSSAERMFGYTKDEAIGNNLTMLMCDDDARHHDGYIKKSRRDGQKVVLGKSRELFAVRKNGEVFPVEIVISALRLVKQDYFVGMIRDISERKAINEQLKQALQEAESANVLKSEFLANMSHEVRTPLNAIYGVIQLLQKEKSLSPHAVDLLEKADFSSQNLLKIINDILDFSKIEAEKLDLEEMTFDVVMLVKHAVATVMPLVREKNLVVHEHYSIGQDAPRVGDPTRITQILNNLLSNAIKFADRGEIIINLYEDKNDKNELLTCIQVKDSGVGMTEQQLMRLFNRFEQADGSITRQYGGTGLGLSITRSLVELMGGTITVQSVLGKGSCFTVSLPLAIGQLLDTENKFSGYDMSMHEISNRLAGKKILVVDDQAMNRELVGLVLEEEDAELIYAENGEEAVTLALSNEPDLILMDIQMPVMDGLTACLRLRQQDYTATIIALTANVMAEDIRQYLAAGFDGHLAKPVNLNELIDVVITHLEIKNVVC